jgi:hypothetical protein
VSRRQQLAQNSKGSSGTALAVGAGQGWVAPTPGNLLVCWANADSTVTGPAGWTAGPSVVDGNAAYAWYKVADGTETTVTPGGFTAASPAHIIAAEYDGIVTPVAAVQNSASRTTAGIGSPAASVSPAAGNGTLVLALGAFHSTPANIGDLGGLSFTGGLTVHPALTARPGGGSTTAVDLATLYGEAWEERSGVPYTVGTTWPGAGTTSAGQTLVMAFQRAARAIPAQAEGSRQVSRLDAFKNRMRGA